MNKECFQVFSNDTFGQITVLMRGGEPWFISKEISVKLLGYSNTEKMTRRLNKDEIIKLTYKECIDIFQTHPSMEFKINNNGMSFINMSGLHNALSSTRNIDLQKKKDLYKWLTSKNFEDSITKNHKEITFLNKLEKCLEPFNIKGIKQYLILSYKIDYYIENLNFAIEYDENNHSNYTYDSHEGRQHEIENKLNCKFVRVNDENSDEYNIGLVIKEIFNL